MLYYFINILTRKEYLYSNIVSWPSKNYYTADVIVLHSWIRISPIIMIISLIMIRSTPIESPSSSTPNPLAEPVPIWYGLYKRLKLFPWWIRYNIGLAHEAVLKDKIIQSGYRYGVTR